VREDAPRTKVVLVARFQAVFPDQQPFLDRLLAVNPVRHLRGILELAHHYPPSAMIAAFQAACEYSTYSMNFIRGVLQQQTPPLATAPTPTGVLADVPRLVIKRDLRAYQRLLDAVAPGGAR
jgi:hypothetical protein